MISDVLKNFNLFVDGFGFAGQIEEFTPPKLAIKTDEFRGGGRDASVAVDMGMEKLECEFKLSGYDRGVLSLWGVGLGLPVVLTARGALQNELGIVLPLVINMTGKLSELDMGTWKAGDKALLAGKVALTYYKLTHGPLPLIEIDVENMVRVVGGVDHLALMRLALGV